ncbi:Sensor histidine kinase RcsC [Vibrio sp. NH-UV-68]
MNDTAGNEIKVNTQSTQTKTIRKTLIIGALTIVSLLVIFFYTDRALVQTKNKLVEFQNDILAASNSMLMMRRHEKDFIARVDKEYLEEMEQAYQHILSQFERINANIASSGIESDYDGQQALNYLDSYVQRFYQLADVVLLIYGTTDNKGLIDNLKNKTLAFERILIDEESKQLNVMVLSAQDLMYQFFSDFNPSVLAKIERSLEQMQLQIINDGANVELSRHFQEFRLAFYALRGAYEQFGYSHNQGQLGELRTTIHQLEETLNTLFNVLPIHVNNQVAMYENYRFLALILLVASILLILFYVTRQTSMLEQQLIDAREHEQKANQAKSAFLTNMSHEIRTPLNGIIGMTEILRDSRLSAIQKDYLATINASSQTLLMLINDILDLSKIESGHIEICLHTTAIKETIFDTAALIAPKAQQKSLDIHIDLDPKLPDYIKADEQKLRQTLMNLASNAIKFTEIGCITFSLQLTSQTDSTVTISFSVKDTGIGIDETKQQQVFEEFKQEHVTTSKDYGGTGLGLSICSKMVAMMGGKVELISVKGLGSEFRFELEFEKDSHQMSNDIHVATCYFSDSPNPLLESDLTRYSIETMTLANGKIETTVIPEDTVVLFDDHTQYQALKRKFSQQDLVFICDNRHLVDTNDLEVSAFLTSPLFGQRLLKTLRDLRNVEASQPRSTTKSQSAFKVLVVDDNRVNQQVVTLNLQKQSIDFVIANNGQEAVEIFEQDHENIGLILMDCVMPVLDGFEATKAIRAFEQQQDLKRTPIIALTAAVLDDDIQNCYKSGMDDYIPKPFKREVLMEKLAILRH